MQISKPIVSASDLRICCVRISAAFGCAARVPRTRPHPRDLGRSLAESSGVNPEPPCPVLDHIGSRTVVIEPATAGPVREAGLTPLDSAKTING